MQQVLIVSPDADFRAVAGRVLARAGYHVTEAAHAGHALIACIQAPDLNVLVIDERGAEDDAMDVARRLRRYSRNLRAVSLRDRPGPNRADAAVVRPFTADDLLAAIEAASRQPTSSAS